MQSVRLFEMNSANFSNMRSSPSNGAQDKSPNANNSMQRVTVYRLCDDGIWDEQGTGHVAVDYMEGSENLGLLVIDEEDNETLLLHRISSDDIYRKQEDSIISWRDPGFSTELALSFQETTGCSYIWDHLCSVQRNMHFLSNETHYNVNNDLRELAPVELSTLPSILKTLVGSGIVDRLRVTELIIHDQDFFWKLIDLFRICEDLAKVDCLHMIFKIVRGIILLNNPQIFERIFRDELIMDIIGCLEYDPEVPHVHHRIFLKEHVVFKEVIPIKDPVILSKIHQTYRVGYLKDVILPRTLDEATVVSFNSIIQSNNATVVSFLKDDCTFIQDLFAKLKTSSTCTESKKTLVHFLHEFCTASKSLQRVHQLRLFRDLVSEGIFDIIVDVLQNGDKKLALAGIDILILFTNQDPDILISQVTRHEGVLFGLLVKKMLTNFSDDMHCQFLEILRSLLDSYAAGSQRDAIVEMFYENHLDKIIDVIISSCPTNGATGQTRSKSMSSDGGIGNESGVMPEILLNICDLLCFCVVHHPCRIKCNFLLNNVVDKVLYLTRRKEKYLVVAAVRFMRTLISCSDDHMMKHIVQNNLFKPIVDVFVANGDRYNLLNSAVLELFEYIRKENIKILLGYIVDSFWDQLVPFDNLSSIHALKDKHEQSRESGETRNTDSLDHRKRLDHHGLEKEEDFFNDSDEEDSASASMAGSNRVQSQLVLANGSTASHPSQRSGGLVDYDDDDSDAGYKPPPKKLLDFADEVEGVAEFTFKRKLVSKEEPEPKRLQWKPREGVFAALCSTLSQVVLPIKKSESAALNVPVSDATANSIGSNNEEKGSRGSSCENRSADVEIHTDKEEPSCRNFTDSLHSSPDNKQLGDDYPLLPPNSSTEMAVNGS